MMRRPASSRRRAYTLVELVVTMGSAAILLAGITSTMAVALRASNPANSPASAMLQAEAVLADMANDLQFTLAITASNPTSITVTAPDRSDPDTAPDTIRYAWSGTAGAPLTRQQNGGAVAIVLSSVQSFSMDYNPNSGAPDWITVRIQPTASTLSACSTSIPLLNR